MCADGAVSIGPVVSRQEDGANEPLELESKETVMATAPNRKVFVNLAVRDLDRSKEFFAALGFRFDPQFTDEKGACMIVSDQAFVMLLAEPFFKTFTRRELCDTTRHTEGLFALSCESRAEVDHLVKTAIAEGGKYAMDPQDHGFMYGWSFYDLDGHHWEVLWMDPAALQKE
jgi:predicted lactoylglutathione lyase